MVTLMSAASLSPPPSPDLKPWGIDRRVLERARASRDPRFDGRFFVAVPSTGVYCRPVCPAPLARSANVRYFATAAAAAEAGFRPCLRCRPEAAPGTPAWLGSSAVVRRALRLIEAGALDGGSVDRLAARVGTGPRHLHRLFVRHVGAPPVRVAQTRKLHFAKQLLDETDLPVTQIAFEAGFGSLRRFNDAFRRTYARAPREIRREGRKVADSSTGPIRLQLAYRPPYDWACLHNFLAARAIPGVERVEGLRYERVITLPAGEPGGWAGPQAIVRVRPVIGCDVLELSVSGAPTGALFSILAAARRTFDLDADPVLISRTLRRDPLLGPLVRRRPGLRIPGAWDPFECAVRAVLGQQVSVAAARTLAGRLVARAGRSLGADRPASAAGDSTLEYAFPTPQALLQADLSGLGVTGARIATIRTLARAMIDGSLDFGARAETLAAALEEIPGIGAWTAQYIALRALGEPDALPAADLVLRRMAAQRGRDALTASALNDRATPWRPWRSYAVMHLWQAATEAASERRNGK